MGEIPPVHFDKKEALCLSCKLKIWYIECDTRDGIVVLMHIAWAAITTSVSRVYQNLQFGRGIVSHASVQ